MTTSVFVAALVSGLRKMAKMNDVIRDTHGNLSVLAPGGVVCIKPSGMPYEQIQVEDVVCVAISDGEILMGKRKPSVDLPHHLAIYRKYPHVHSICHTHSPYAVGYAISGRDLEVRCTEHADYFGHDIRTTGRPDIDRWGDELLLDPDEKAVLLYQHGVLTFGDTPNKAVELAAALENIAQKNYIAHTLNGGNCRLMHGEDVKAWHKRYNTTYGQ